MRIFNALYTKELSYIKKRKGNIFFYAILSFFFPLIFLLFNKTPHQYYSIINVILIFSIIFIPANVIESQVSKSMMFESFDGMIDFLLSQGINKITLILSKIFSPLLLGVLLSIIPIIEYKILLVPSSSIMDLFKIELAIIFGGIISSLLTIFIRTQSILFISMLYMLLGKTIFVIVIITLLHSFTLFMILSTILIIILFGINCKSFDKKETVINFERIK